MGEFADSETLELEKSLLTVSKGQAQNPHACLPAVSWAGLNTFPGSLQAAGLGWTLALRNPGQTKVF